MPIHKLPDCTDWLTNIRVSRHDLTGLAGYDTVEGRSSVNPLFTISVTAWIPGNTPINKLLY